MSLSLADDTFTPIHISITLGCSRYLQEGRGFIRAITQILRQEFLMHKIHLILRCYKHVISPISDAFLTLSKLQIFHQKQLTKTDCFQFDFVTKNKSSISIRTRPYCILTIVLKAAYFKRLSLFMFERFRVKCSG